MKKITLLLALIAFVFNGFSQGKNLPQAELKCQISEAQHYSLSEYNDLKSTTTWGDVIWSEDFGGGQIPADWVVVDNNGLGYVWYWSDDVVPGQTGTYSANNDTFFSTTASNGYIMISGDIYNAGGGATNMDSYFITGPINCDTATSVMVKFEQYFRNCCSSSSTSLNMSVSTDNVTWVDYSVINGVAINAASDDPDVVMINVTSIAAGQSTVYLKFHKSGASHYFWAIDDIALITAPMNEIKLEKTYNSFLGTFGTDYGHSGYYSQIPVNQFMPLYLAGDVKNKGVLAQHNVTLNSKVLDASGTELFNETGDTSVLASDSLVYLDMAVNFEPAGTGDYSITWECYQDEVDEIPENNFGDTVDFSITDNGVYARDIMRTGTVSPDNYVDGADGDLVGVNYYMYESDTVKSISVYVYYTTDPNTILIARLYQWDGTDNVLIISSDEYVITPSDIGTWVEIPFVTAAAGDDILDPQFTYIAGVELYWDNDELRIGSDDTDPHWFQYEADLRIGANWYWISEVPMIRLNFLSAITAPNFTSEPVIEQPLNVAYDYTAVVDDANASFTVDVNDAGVQLDYTDNNDGTVTITTPVLESLGYSVGDSYRIIIRTDNGTESNEQYFWVDIVEPIGINDVENSDLSIYPNPAQEVLFVNNAEHSDIYIYNLLGEVVLSVKDAGSLSKINIAGLAEGTYVVSVISDNKVYTEKFNHIR